LGLPKPEERMLAMPRIIPKIVHTSLGRDLRKDTLLDGGKDDDREGRSVLERVEERTGVLVVGRHILDDALAKTDKVGKATRFEAGRRGEKQRKCQRWIFAFEKGDRKEEQRMRMKANARGHKRDDPRTKVWAFDPGEDETEGDPKVADDFGERGEDVGGDDVAEEDGLADR
jgi:hypothetical protein